MAYDRTREDVGNILMLEHVNVTVPDQSLATWFYVNGLGLTRDPYIDFGPFNVWINAGRQQFHLPTNSPQVLRGHTGLIVPDLEDLEARLTAVRKRLADTQFAFERAKNLIDVTCPWGNRIRCFSPDAFASMSLGIPYVELSVPKGTAEGIARFYSEIMGAPAMVSRGTCKVHIGSDQTLRFKETKRPIAEYDGHHIAIYVADFSGPHDAIDRWGFISEESDQHQYRFVTLFDPGDGTPLFELEHEVRSLHHPMFNRPLANRNPAQSLAEYVKGRDAFQP